MGSAAGRANVASTHGLRFWFCTRKVCQRTSESATVRPARYRSPKMHSGQQAASPNQAQRRISRRGGARALPKVQETAPQKGEMERREAPGSWAAPRERMLPPARASGAARATERFPRENRLLRARGASRRSTAVVAKGSLPAGRLGTKPRPRIDRWPPAAAIDTVTPMLVTELMIIVNGKLTTSSWAILGTRPKTCGNSARHGRNGSGP